MFVSGNLCGQRFWPMEALLRGGCLPELTRLRDLVVHNDRQWVRLRKTDDQLRVFLCAGGARSNKKAFHASRTLERILALRESAEQELIKQWASEDSSLCLDKERAS